jgi:hypothetical protein
VHAEIREVLGDRSLRGEALGRALFALGARRLIEPFRALLLDLLGLDLPEPRARSAVYRIEEHRSALTRALGSDPGFEVAAADHLHEIEGFLREPVFGDGPAASGAAAPGSPRAVPAPPGGDAMERARAARSRRPLSFVALEPDAPLPRAGFDLAASLAAIREAARDTDLARGAGAGIAVLLPCTPGDGALRAAERYRRVLADSTGLAWSAGVAAVAGEDPDRAPLARPDGLAERARAALLGARAAGGDRAAADRSERRAHPRRAGAGAIGVRIVADPPAGEAVVENVSLGGALLATRRALAPGSQVLLALRGAAVRAREFVVATRVGRAIARPAAPLPWGAAIAFPADSEARLRIAGLLADLPRPAAPPGGGGPAA